MTQNENIKEETKLKLIKIMLIYYGDFRNRKNELRLALIDVN